MSRSPAPGAAREGTLSTADKGVLNAAFKESRYQVSPAQSPILVAEDNADHALLIRKTFEAVHIANPLHVVRDGDAAITLLAPRIPVTGEHEFPTPVLVLLDVHLPRKSGLEVLEWIRGQSSLEQLAVVMLSSSNDETDIRRAYELGASSYLIKPVGFGAMQEVVRTLGLYWYITQKPKNGPK